MRTTLFSIAFLIATSCLGQGANKSISIITCSPGFIYRYANHKIELLAKVQNPGDKKIILYSKAADKKASAAFDKLFDKFAKLDKRVVYLNSCISDGISFKVYIQVGSSLQKIFVSNYYDSTIDSLPALFDEQLKDFNTDNHIGYGTDKKEIAELIESQKNCDEAADSNKYKDYKNRVLDSWCELDEQLGH